MRIATWNLDRPSKNGKTTRAAAQLKRLQEVDADIWILTETYSAFVLPGYVSVASPSSGGTYDVDESAAAIWVREDWPLKKLAESHHTVVAEVLSPLNATPLVVYGSIIPYRDARPGTAWERHMTEANRQSQEWVSIRKAKPSHALIVAGDFNMTLHSDTGYGKKEGGEIVRAGFDAVGLTCVSAIDIRAAKYGAQCRDNIDHLAVGKMLECAGDPTVWSGTVRDGMTLSDHNGIAIDVHL